LRPEPRPLGYKLLLGADERRAAAAGGGQRPPPAAAAPVTRQAETAAAPGGDGRSAGFLAVRPAPNGTTDGVATAQ